MPGTPLDQPVPCPECDGSGTSRYANGMGGQRQQCFKCHGSGEVLACAKCGAGPDEECNCTPDSPDMMPEELDDETCPECGAPAGFEHDVGCPNATLPGPDPDRYREGVEAVKENAGFDKFMDRIVLQERGARTVAGKENNPARLIAGKYQERPLGRIRYGVKR